MLTIGDKFPEFNLLAVDGGPLANKIEDAFTTISDKSYEGKWKLVFFYPKDFTFVCPTEIKGFSDLNEQFADRDCQILAASTDSEFVHRAWRMDHADLKDLKFPMLADIKKELTSALGILTNDGVAQRATFLVDPNGEIQFAYVTAGSVGRNPDEVLRVLDALQTDELCACNWKAGDDTLKVA
ncbi:peroxiredoxin [Luteibacter aegosomaticola]|jgi:Peroxiredoxin|uniref:peroxiredoxin n=1 Tax=Luteibacter TaxID=242605 RepID=UPI001FF813F4|nr:peroxiredoxin [Luteibacter aegosomaticola]UPG89241.1 peroxiredoxin [Luteibacter aegosomaticola]